MECCSIDNQYLQAHSAPKKFRFQFFTLQGIAGGLSEPTVALTEHRCRRRAIRRTVAEDGLESGDRSFAARRPLERKDFVDRDCSIV